MTDFDHEETIIYIIGYIATGLSFLGLLWITYLFFRTQAGWTFSGKIILCLTVSYFLFTLANFLLIFNSNTVVCKIEGFFHTFSILSSFYWAWKISRTAYFTITDEYFRPDPKTRWIVLFRGFLVPLIIALVPIIGFGQCSYGLVSRECGIEGNSPRDSLIWDVCLVTAPTALGLAIITYYYIKIKEESKELEDAIKVYCDRFLVYPLCLFLIWLPSLAFRISLYFGGYVFWLDATRTAIEYSLGFIHALICTLQGIAVSRENKTKDYGTEITVMGNSRAGSEEFTPGGKNRTFDSFAL